MSINIIHLNKLLRLMYMPNNVLILELRKDIRTEIKKNSGQSTGGGDFYQPMWHDIKRHVLGEIDLTEATEARVAANQNRKNLYPRLAAGFLKLWLRGGNQQVAVLEKSPKGRYDAIQGELTIKVESVMGISIDGNERLGYPYWFPDPALSEEAARVGLWAMERALGEENKENMRIFDIVRSEFYSLQNLPLKGNEEKVLLDNFHRISKLREKLRAEYK